MITKKPAIKTSIDRNIFYTGKPKWLTILLDVLIFAMCIVFIGFASIAMATSMIKFAFGGLV